MPQERGKEFLTQIASEIQTKDEADEAARIAREELDRKGLGVYKNIWQILHQKGTTVYQSISVGAGGEIIGYRTESHRYSFTPTVKVEINDQKFILNLEEILGSRPGYTIISEEVAIKAKLPDSEESKIIFRVNKYGTGKDHLGEEIKNGDIFDKVAELLQLVDEQLPLPEPKKELPRQLRVNRNLVEEFRKQFGPEKSAR